MEDHQTKASLSKNAETQDGRSRRRQAETLGEGNGTDQGTLREKHGVGGSSPSRRTISRDRLDEIASIPDDEIDLSDVPEQGPEFFERATRQRYRANVAPPHLTRIMCQCMEIARHHRVLEPSAGRGGMVKVISEFTPNIVSVELNAGSLAFLKESASALIAQQAHHADFLTINPADFGLFDRVVMCPPKDTIPHLNHAQQFLRPDGKLMALVQDQNITNFPALSGWKVYPLRDEEFEFDGEPIRCSIWAWGF